METSLHFAKYMHYTIVTVLLIFAHAVPLALMNDYEITVLSVLPAYIFIVLALLWITHPYARLGVISDSVRFYCAGRGRGITHEQPYMNSCFPEGFKTNPLAEVAKKHIKEWEIFIPYINCYIFLLLSWFLIETAIYKVMYLKERKKEPLKWAYWASERGDLYAQYYMGYAFAMGHSLPKNYAKSYTWLSLSIDESIHSKNEINEQCEVKFSAEDLIKRIQHEMTDDDVIKSQEMIEKYKDQFDKIRKGCV